MEQLMIQDESQSSNQVVVGDEDEVVDDEDHLQYTVAITVLMRANNVMMAT